MLKKKYSISIIIPVLDESAIIQKTLLRLQNDVDIEIIVVDGGSQDNTIKQVQALGVKIIPSPYLGRAYQMNLGAATATGDILLFLHADTVLPSGYQALVKQALSYSHIVAGAFELAINGEQKALRLVEKLVNWRSHFFQLPYGDQGIFLKATIFKEMGGFANIPIMEDFEFIERLKQKGKIAIISAAIITSGRRWQQLGIIKTTLINQLIVFGYYLNVPLTVLARLYYGRKKKGTRD